MQFSHSNDGGNKAGKFLLVAGLHVAIGAVFIHSMNSRHLSLPRMTEQVLVMLDPQRVDPPPPPEPPPMPPQSMPKIVPPTLAIPQPEVDVAPPPDATPLHASTTADPAPATPAAATGVPDALPVPAGAPVKAAAQVRTAVLADPNACALPDYPARAAREGISGTTLLALLVGTDGRVTSSRVERSSGSRDLDRAAVNALSLCRFKPATSNGVPEAGWAQLAYVWTLDQ